MKPEAIPSPRISVPVDKNPKGAKAMLGFAATFRTTKTTAEWMEELREGEKDDADSASYCRQD